MFQRKATLAPPLLNRRQLRLVATLANRQEPRKLPHTTTGGTLASRHVCTSINLVIGSSGHLVIPMRYPCFHPLRTSTAWFCIPRLRRFIPQQHAGFRRRSVSRRPRSSAAGRPCTRVGTR